MSPSLLLFCALTFFSGIIAASDIPLDKRQDKGPEVNITFENTGGDFSAGGMPLVCAEGCIPAMMNFVLCDEANTTREGAGPNRPDGLFDPLYSAPCKWLCSETNYTGFTQCLNCYVANGAEANESHIKGTLAQGNQFCEGRVQSIVSEITATPTTTLCSAATQTSFTESTLTLPTWTGLTSFLAAYATETGEQGSSSTSSTASSSGAPAASSSGAALPKSCLEVGKSSSVGILAAMLGLLLL